MSVPSAKLSFPEINLLLSSILIISFIGRTLKKWNWQSRNVTSWLKNMSKYRLTPPTLIFVYLRLKLDCVGRELLWSVWESPGRSRNPHEARCSLAQSLRPWSDWAAGERSAVGPSHQTLPPSGTWSASSEVSLQLWPSLCPVSTFPPGRRWWACWCGDQSQWRQIGFPGPNCHPSAAADHL